MKASIVIPAYNCKDFLSFTLNSLANQDIGKENYEVIVIDDGSSDNTASLLANYNAAFNLKKIFNEKNIGRARARNRGIAAAENELIIFLDSDIEVKPDFVRLHLEEQKKGVRACVGKVVFHPDIKKTAFMKYLDKRGPAKKSSGEQLPGKYFRTTNASVPKSILTEIESFDENFIYYGGEDLEIGLRVAEKIPIFTLPEAIGYNRHARTLLKGLDIIRVYGEHSLPYLLKLRPELKKEIMHEGKIYSTLLPLICSKPVYAILYKAAQLGLAPAIVFNYLLFCSYREGYLQTLKNKKI
ncbi:MAG TPA: glycosyltransferase family 2 protein [Ignavibacteria bacterium]|jgi:glycosyltransferase involved in cell wall biosynthesis